MRKAVATFVAFALLAFAGVGGTAAKSDRTCANDMRRYVEAGGGCFAIDVVGRAEFEPGQPLVVFMHGDSGASKNRKYFGSYAAQFRALEQEGVYVLALARPAYRLPHGKTTGIPGRFNNDPYTVPVVDGLAAALKALKDHYRPSRLVLLGHSGGSMISGILLGRHPGLADGAVLVASSCDTREQRRWRIRSAGRKRLWPESLSPHDYIATTPISAKVVAITGERDRNTLPGFAKKCVEKMRSRGIDARFGLVTTPAFANHGQVMKSPVVTRAVLDVSGVEVAK